MLFNIGKWNYSAILLNISKFIVNPLIFFFHFPVLYPVLLCCVMVLDPYLCYRYVARSERKTFVPEDISHSGVDFTSSFHSYWSLHFIFSSRQVNFILFFWGGGGGVGRLTTRWLIVCLFRADNSHRFFIVTFFIACQLICATIHSLFLLVAVKKN